LIGKKNGEYIDAVLKVGTSELLKTLITYSIDKFNRDELTKLGGEVSKQFTTEYKTYTDAATKKQVEEIVIKTTEGLNELKNEIISLDDIKELLATLIG
jgi:DnaJ-domain-containing protein 1